LPAQLLESELFGHERGAFTDAKERKLGLVEAADGGMLFLDEIGDLEPALQTKLLKLLEERTVRRVGGLRDRTVDVRFVSATNRPLEDWVREGKFRSDLYFRLRVLTIEAPPLRDRDGDVKQLGEYFLAKLSQRYGRVAMRFSESALSLLRRHNWPGNVRELKNTLEQAILMAKGAVVDADDLSMSQRLEKRAPVANALDSLPRVSDDAEPSDWSLVEIERGVIADAFDKSKGDVTRAAKLLGISRDTLRYRLEKHRLR
jgi:transcriptional regulator with PAS, ATPase and Fis domain